MKTLLLALLITISAHAKTIMVIDTLINKAHEKFVDQDIIIHDYDGPYSQEEKNLGYLDHGTGMLSLIIHGKDMKDTLKIKHKYIICSDYANASLACYYLALNLKVDVINYSGGGTPFVPMEKLYIEKLSKKGVKMFFAAGNEGKNLHETPYYPAAFAGSISATATTSATLPILGVVAVAAIKESGELAYFSNYGDYVKKELGYRVLCASYDGKYKIQNGTSHATALATHAYLKSLEK